MRWVLVPLGLVALGVGGSGCGQAKPGSERGDDPLARADLLLSVETSPIPPGAEFTVAVDLAVPDGWHTYWENPGETGMAPELRWSLPAGWRLVAVHYPVPERMEDGGVVSIGYEGSTRILADIRTDPATSGEARIDLEADWMICREVCVPVASRAGLVVRVGTGTTSAGENQGTFQGARGRLPRSTSEWRVALRRTPEALELRVVPTGGGGPTEGDWPTAQVFAKKRGLIDLTMPSRWTRDGDAWLVRLAPGPASLASGEVFEALIVVTRAGASQGWRISAQAPE